MCTKCDPCIYDDYLDECGLERCEVIIQAKPLNNQLDKQEEFV